MSDKFIIHLNTDSFRIGDLIVLPMEQELEVISMPKKKWWQKLLQYITFGYYKAGWHYKVKIKD